MRLGDLSGAPPALWHLARQPAQPFRAGLTFRGGPTGLEQAEAESARRPKLWPASGWLAEEEVEVAAFGGLEDVVVEEAGVAAGGDWAGGG